MSESLVDGLTSALAGKQPTMADGDLQISAVSGLQAAINGAGSNVGGVGDVPGLQSALNSKANAANSYSRTHIDSHFFTIAAQTAQAAVATALFDQEAADTVA